MLLLKRRLRLAGLPAVIFALSLIIAPTVAQASAAAGAGQGGELVVGFKRSVASADKTQAIRLVKEGGGRLQATLPGAYLFTFQSKDEARSVSAKLRKQRYVRYTEIPRAVRAAALPNDPLYSHEGQWGLRRIGAETAWNTVTGSGVIVAVLDTGIDLNHPELAPKLQLNASDLPDGIDNDRNGRIDDYRGWNFVSNNGNPRDDAGHGTHVAGIAAAQGNNAAGVAGVAWDARILPLKVLDANGDGNTWDVAAGIRYAVARGAKVINLSFGGPGFSKILADAVSFARKRNVLMVAAAGNRISGIAFPYVAYPAAYDGVLGIGAVDTQGAIPSWSNQGSFVDLVAPGSRILSSSWRPGVGSTYDFRSGTSMASAFVAGEAALLWSENPRASLEAVENAILISAKDVGSGGRDNFSGRGEISLSNAFLVQNLRPAPATFSPDSDGTEDATSLGYRLLAPARVSLSVTGNGRTVRSLLSLAGQEAGDQTVAWDGRAGGGFGLSNGIYRLVIAAAGPEGTGYRQVEVGLASPPPRVSTIWSEPNPFAPNGDGHNDAAALHYSVDRPGYVTVKIFSAKGVIRTVRNDAFRPAGNHADQWNGLGLRGQPAAPGSYGYEIIARNSHGKTSARGTVRLRPEPLPAAEELTGIEQVTAQGNEGTERPPVSFCYALGGEALVTVTVFQGQRKVKTLLARKFRSGGSHCEGWTGTDDGGRLLSAGSYSYTIFAANSQGTRSYRGITRLGS